MEDKPSDAFLIGSAAGYVGCSVSWLNFLHAVGELNAERAMNGYRIFRREDLDRLKAKRVASEVGPTGCGVTMEEIKLTNLDKLLTVQQLAQLLQLKQSWIYQNMNSLPHLKFQNLVRFSAEDVSEILRKARCGPPLASNGKK